MTITLTTCDYCGEPTEKGDVLSVCPHCRAVTEAIGSVRELFRGQSCEQDCELALKEFEKLWLAGCTGVHQHEQAAGSLTAKTRGE